ncbi:MAG: type I methionyl aminopeptidase [Candidatus Shapirobacteria bacterium]
MVIIKTPKQIEGIRLSSCLAAQTLAHTASYIRPGVSTATLNDIAHQFITSHDAIPAPLGYGGFPKSICVSINNVVCHGIPNPKTKLKVGDIVNLDITTILGGFYGDVSASYPVGVISTQAQKLIDVTRESLNRAIDAIKPGVKLNRAVGETIEKYVTSFGFTPVQELGGHGVGLKFHEDPFVFHYKNPQGDIRLKPGMIFTVEPMVNASDSWKVYVDSKDGWTVTTADGALSAQFEHTILVTPEGCEVLTQL